MENEELVYGARKDHIIWDPDSMDEIPEPTVLILDPNDEDIILGGYWVEGIEGRDG